MSLATDTLITRIVDHFAATLPTSPDSARWTRSRFLPPSLGQDTEAKSSRCWAVWAPSHTQSITTERQRPAEGSLVISTVEIGFTFQLRQDNTVADYAAALAAEDVLRSACVSVSRAGLPKWVVTGSNRSVSPDGRTMVTLLTWSAAHTIPLQ